MNVVNISIGGGNLSNMEITYFSTIEGDVIQGARDIRIIKSNDDPREDNTSDDGNECCGTCLLYTSPSQRD